MPAKMPQPMRALMAAATFATRNAKVPTPAEVMATPMEQRWAKRPSRLMCKAGARNIVTDDVIVAGRDGNQIPVRTYRRPDTQPAAPGLLFIHGGGFVDGGIDWCDSFQRDLADRSGYIVVALSYRLAPEHPFPAALHDCADVLQWMSDSKPSGLDAGSLAVAGESAGGNLAVAVCLHSRAQAGPPVSQATAYYPFTDTSLSSSDWDTGLMGPFGTRAAGEAMIRAYCPEDRDSPLVNILGADHRGLPPTTIVTCGHDVLPTDGALLAESLKAAGVDTTRRHHDDMPHGFLTSSRMTKRVDQAIDDLVYDTRKAFGRARSAS